MAFFAWAFNTFFVKLHVTPVKLLIKSMLFVTLFYAALFNMPPIQFFWVQFFMKCTLLGSVAVLLLWKERFEIIGYIKTLINHETN